MTFEIREKPTECSYDDQGMLEDADSDGDSELEDAPMIVHVSTSIGVTMTYGNPYDDEDGF